MPPQILPPVPQMQNNNNMSMKQNNMPNPYYNGGFWLFFMKWKKIDINFKFLYKNYLSKIKLSFT